MAASDLVERLAGTERLPWRLVPEDWKTAFVAGSVVLGAERALVLAAMAGRPMPACSMFVLDRERTAWRPSEVIDGAAVLWLSAAPSWLVRYEVEDDVCLCARQDPGCLPDAAEVYWLSAGGALTASGFEPTDMTERIGRMKARYDRSALRLCSEAALIRELIASTEAALASDLAVPECRAVASLLHRMRPIPLPVPSINAVLGLVEALGFWPGAAERVRWTDEVLRELDARRDAVMRLRGPDTRRALVDLLTVAKGRSPDD